MKLLARNAEERYQTASGVEADLQRCLAEWESSGRIDAFPLGTHDASERLLIAEKLYGREAEIEALLAAFDRVMADGTPALVLVSGYSGVGKFSVVNEMHKVLVQPRGLRECRRRRTPSGRVWTPDEGRFLIAHQTRTGEEQPQTNDENGTKENAHDRRTKRNR